MDSAERETVATTTNGAADNSAGVDTPGYWSAEVEVRVFCEGASEDGDGRTNGGGVREQEWTWWPETGERESGPASHLALRLPAVPVLLRRGTNTTTNVNLGAQ